MSDLYNRGSLPPALLPAKGPGKKIRCDGGQPCLKCQNTSEECTYSYSTQPKQSKAILSSTVDALREKLREAEAALQYKSYLPPNTSSTNYPEPHPLSPSFLNPPTSHTLSHSAIFRQPVQMSQPVYAIDLSTTGYDSAAPLTISPIRADTTLFDNPTTQDNLTTADVPDTLTCGSTSRDDFWASSPRNASSQSSLSQPSSAQRSMCEFMTAQTSLTLPGSAVMPPQNVLNDLSRCYFSTIHHSYPMIDDSRFRALADEMPSRSESISLRHAIWAHAALLSPAYVQYSEQFYHQARNHIEDIDREADQGYFSISALQALVLIALYEIKQTYFTRSWASVARATCLAHALDLHTMDGDSCRVKDNRRKELLPWTDDPSELEERRRTFWVVLHINCFSGVSVSWTLNWGFDEAEISTLLPVKGTQDENPPSRRISLAEILKYPIRGILTPWQGVTLATSLCIRCISHVSQLNKQQTFGLAGYSFWEQHHYLNSIIKDVCTPSLAHLKTNTYTAEPNVISLNMIIQTTIICLHQAVIYRVDTTKGPNHPTEESERRCMEAAIETIAIVRCIHPSSIAQMNPFIPWTFYVVLQYLIRTTEAKQRLPISRPQVNSPPPETTHAYHDYPRHPTTTTSDRYSSYSPTASSNSVSGSSTSFSSTGAGSPLLAKGRLLDSIEMLRFGLSALKTTNSLAKVFEAQINEEIEGGEVVTKERFVGLVDFFSKGL